MPDSPALQPVLTRRLVLALCAAVVIVAGLSVHRLGTGTGGDIAGDALYASLIYALVAFVFPRAPRSLIAAVAIALCTAIELFQLTGLPNAWAQHVWVAALIFGTGFDQRDLLVYPLGVLAIALCDVLITRAARTFRTRKTGASPQGDARSN